MTCYRILSNVLLGAKEKRGFRRAEDARLAGRNTSYYCYP